MLSSGAVPTPSAPGRAILSSLAGLFVLAAPAFGQFSARPAIVTLPGDAERSRAVTVKNEGEAEREFRFYPGDFDQRPDGGHVFLEPGSHPRSCAARLSLSPDGAVLRPGETVDVRVTMAPGRETCWSLLFVETVSGVNPDGITVGQRIGIKLYGTDPEGRADGGLDGVRVERSDEGGRVVRFVFENTGELPVRPEGDVEVRSLEGDLVASVPVVPFSVLPGHRREARVPLGAKIPPGRYLVLPVLDIGREFLVGGQAAFRARSEDEPLGGRRR